MERREFIQKSAGAIAALSVVNLVKAAPQFKDGEEKIFFRLSETVTKAGTEYAMTYNFQLPKNAEECEVYGFRLMVMQEGDTEEECTYSITVKKCKSKGSKNWFKCKGYTLLKGPALLRFTKFEQLLKGKSWLVLEPKEDNESTLAVLNKKKTRLATMSQYVAPEGGCFLTTACVEHIGMPDNCLELETLRTFRDDFVAKSSKGQNYIKEYYRLAPQMVAIINGHPEKENILSAIYNDMVLPAMTLVNKGKKNEALSFYKDYTLILASSLEVN